MRQNVFYAIVLVCSVTAIALRVVYGHVITSLLEQVEVTLGWGYVGLLVALAVTYPFVRSVNVIVIAVVVGWLPMFVLLFGPSFACRPIQMWRRGVVRLDASDLARRPRAGVAFAELTGVWRYDLAARGTYRTTQTSHPEGDCKSYNLYDSSFCRAPVVGEGWKPGDPVLAIARCGLGSPKDAVTRQNYLVELWRADEVYSDGATAFREGDPQVHKVRHSSTCVGMPDDVFPDLSKAPFAFDRSRGVLVLSKEGDMDPRTAGKLALGLAGGFLALILGWVLLRLPKDPVDA